MKPLPPTVLMHAWFLKCAPKARMTGAQVRLFNSIAYRLSPAGERFPRLQERASLICWPSYERLVTDTELGIRTVRRELPKLLDFTHPVIYREPRPERQGRHPGYYYVADVIEAQRQIDLVDAERDNTEAGRSKGVYRPGGRGSTGALIEGPQTPPTRKEPDNEPLSSPVSSLSKRLGGSTDPLLRRVK